MKKKNCRGAMKKGSSEEEGRTECEMFNHELFILSRLWSMVLK